MAEARSHRWGRRARTVALGLAAGVLLSVVTAVFGAPERATACAFLGTPHAYESDGARASYLTAIDLASQNALLPADPFFATPAIESGPRGARSAGLPRVPAVLLKAIGWVESDMTMAASSVPFESTGIGQVSFDCGYGVMQITSGMTVPLGAGNQATNNQTLVATHYAYNIARGAAMFGEKWNQEEIRPIAGTDTGANPEIVENWYFATWSYNGFTGPGARQSNHPLDPAFSNPRPAYRCDGTQSRTRYPYQELVWGCMATPPTRNGAALWASVPAALPNLTQPQFFLPLAPANFRFPYHAMDIPTPGPFNTAAAPPLDLAARSRILGNPTLSVAGSTITLNVSGGPAAARGTITIRNTGSGVLSWAALPSAGWIELDIPAGIALGADVPCGPSCVREGSITVSVNPVLLDQATSAGTIRIVAPNAGGGEITISVRVNAEFEAGAPGTSRR